MFARQAPWQLNHLPNAILTFLGWLVGTEFTEMSSDSDLELSTWKFSESLPWCTYFTYMHIFVIECQLLIPFPLLF